MWGISRTGICMRFKPARPMAMRVRLPHPPPYASLAQLVEQLICNQQVMGSSPLASSIFPGSSVGRTINC